MAEKQWPTRKQKHNSGYYDETPVLTLMIRLLGSIVYVLVFLFWLLTIHAWALYGWRRWKKTGDWYQFHRGMMRPIWAIQSILHQDWAG